MSTIKTKKDHGGVKKRTPSVPTLKLLKNAIKEIQKENKIELSFAGAHRYTCSTANLSRKRGEKPYAGLKEVITERLREVRLEVITSMHGNFLQTLNLAWNNHTAAMVEISQNLCYMDHGYVPQHNVDSVCNLGLRIFRDEVIRYGGIREHLKTQLLVMIAKERQGELIDRMCVKNACKMLMKLGVDSRSVYEEDFENSFLQQSRDFYRAESQKLMAENSASAYVKQVQQRIQEESERAKDYLDPSTEIKIVHVLEEELVKRHMRRVVEMENSALMQNSVNMLTTYINLKGLQIFFNEKHLETVGVKGCVEAGLLEEKNQEHSHQ